MDLKEKAKKENVKLVFDRYKDQQPQCVFGLNGTCCRNCFAGPCRIISGRQAKGICGANEDVIVVRNLLRNVASGASAHILHTAEIKKYLTNALIKDRKKLLKLSHILGYKGKNIKKAKQTICSDVFNRRMLNLAPKERIKKWKELGILPDSPFDIISVLDQTIMGNDANVYSLLLSLLKIGIVDGYFGLCPATILQDALFGTPTLVKSVSNIGCMKKDFVNLGVHGHIPLVAEKIVEWSKRLEDEAKKAGAKGINVIGVCCSGNEVLMRHGIPLAAHILQSELPIVTGALEALVVDSQCIYPSLQDVASCYHTKIITTMTARIPGTLYIPFSTNDEWAKRVVKVAIINFKNRKQNVFIPANVTELLGGFSVEIIDKLLRTIKYEVFPYLRGIVSVVGCRHPGYNNFVEKIIRQLVKKDFLVVTTGCAAHTAAQSGMMKPRIKKYAGKGLSEMLMSIKKETGVDLPPVWHMGSCVDNSRIEEFCSLIANKLKKPYCSLPIFASAPECMSEKALAIGCWFLSLGIPVHLNPMPVRGSETVTEFLTKDLESLIGSRVITGNTPKNVLKNILLQAKVRQV